jgi:hypothetical protein
MTSMGWEILLRSATSRDLYGTPPAARQPHSAALAGLLHRNNHALTGRAEPAEDARCEGDGEVDMGGLERKSLLSIAGALALLGAGCADDARQCAVGADCASGVCAADGRCVMPAEEDSGGTGLTFPDAGGGDTGGNGTGGGSPDGGGTSTVSGDTSGGTGGSDAGGTPGLCAPNGDGLIERAEIPLSAGLHAIFRTAQDAPIDTAGAVTGGTIAWDLDVALPGDHHELVELQPMEGLWFAESFPDASYAAKLTDEEDLLGVFRITPSALLLLGVVSPEGGLLRTELSYEPPAVVLEFPIEEGATWESTSAVAGVLTGVAALYQEEYASEVDAAGTLDIPLGTFDVLRIDTELVRTAGFVVTTSRTYLFSAECFGTVASIRSKLNETEAEFPIAAEVRRLAP